MVDKQKQMYTNSKFRAKKAGEEWDLTFEQFVELWDGQWDNRGVGVGTSYLKRIDKRQPWSYDNCIVTIRPRDWRHKTKDPVLNKKRNRYQQAKAQAKFRNEPFVLKLEEFLALWKPYWSKRGMNGNDFVMSRIDVTKPWSYKNCYIITRHQQLINTGKRRRENKKLRYIVTTNATVIKGK